MGYLGVIECLLLGRGSGEVSRGGGTGDRIRVVQFVCGGVGPMPSFAYRVIGHVTWLVGGLLMSSFLPVPQ